MHGVNFPEAQHFLGRPGDMEDQDCDALPVARGIQHLPSGQDIPVVISCWEFTEAERKQVAEGGRVYLHVVGRTMQPVILSTKIEAQTLAGSN